MECDPELADRVNSYALVSYIPGPLGDFLTELRQDLVAGCVARSHVSILPPRPLAASEGVVADEIRSNLASFNSFELELTRIETFEQTSVIYCAVGAGSEELVELHAIMNAGSLYFKEPFNYHPHVTLAQGIDPNDLARVRDYAVSRWKEAPMPTRVTIDVVTFVQNTARNIWLDLEECELRGLAALPTR